MRMPGATLALLLALLLAAACATSSVPNADVNNAPNYISLASPDQVRDYDFGTTLPPRGFYVRGTLTSAGFRASGAVQGSGQFCADGKDWLSLSELKVHSAADGKSPVAPYIAGCATKNGFQPASREIVAQ